MWDFRSPNKDEIFALEEWSFNYWTDSEELEWGWVAFFFFAVIVGVKWYLTVVMI